MKRFPEIIDRLYGIVAELEALFPGRPFTPDGHMLGSIGESLAQYYYGVTLNRPSTKGEDGQAACGGVEVKITQREHVAFRCSPKTLLVLKLFKDGRFEEVYNGSGSRVWATVSNKRMPGNGQYPVRLSTLRRLMKDVAEQEKLKMIRPQAGGAYVSPSAKRPGPHKTNE